MKNNTAHKLKFMAQIIFWLMLIGCAVIIGINFYPLAKQNPFVGVLVMLALAVVAYVVCETLRLIFMALAELLSETQDVKRLLMSKENNKK
ncbi:MAG: hypothetical protein IJO93_01200 [Clostridia bacterium]|nr:hypothetical protein [Clostridia bacterium]